LSPGFFSNEALGAIPPLARLAFQGLWCLSDREGRVEDRPSRVKALLFPYEHLTIEEFVALIDALENSGLVSRYSVNGDSYLVVVKFKKHQHPHPKEAQSVLPEPCKATASRVKKRASKAGPSVPSVPAGPSVPSDIPPAAGKPPDVDPPWSREAADDWIAAKGGKPPGKLFALLLPLVRTEGWDRVRPALRHYLGTTGAEFVRIDKFVSAFGEWEARARGQPAPGGAKQTAGEATMAAAGRVLARHQAAKERGE